MTETPTTATEPVAEPHAVESPTPATPHIRKLLVPVLIILVGVGALMYPVIATQFNNLQQQLIVAEYEELLKRENPEKLDQELQQAHVYNEERAQGPILDPWLSRVASDNADYQSYLAQLSSQAVMARVVVPSASIDLPVYHGAEESTLATGVGHIYGSDLPVGGDSTHAVLTGHTGLANGTLFDNLVNVKNGDAIYVTAAGQTIKYEVSDIRVVLPNDIDSLRKQPGQDLLTLVTCTPYGINSHRLLVTGHRVPLDEEDLKQLADDGGMSWQPWMIASAAAAVVVVGLTALWAVRTSRRAKAAIAAEEAPQEGNEE